MAGPARNVSNAVWTADEDRLLKRRYRSTRAAKLAAELDRPVGEVYRRARLLGLHRKHGASQPESQPAPRRRSACNPPSRSPRAREAYLLCRLGGLTLAAAGEKMSLTKQRIDQLIEDYSYAIAADPSLLDQLGQEYSRQHGQALDPAERARRIDRAAELRPPADKAIQRRVDRLRTLGEPLDADSVGRRHPALFSAARTEYGGWEEALAGGKSARRIALESRGWLEQQAVQALCDRIESGSSLAASVVQQEAREIWSEVRRRGGTSYYRGLAALGFDAEAWSAAGRRGRRKWTRERVDRTLREWIDAGRSLRRVDVGRHLPALVSALSLAHGGWYAALAHLGVAQDLWDQRRRRLPVEQITAALQQRIDTGQSLRRCDVMCDDPALFSSVRATCGGWYEGLARHGLDPTPWRAVPQARHWTAERLARALQERLDRGRSLGYTDVRREHPALVSALRKRHPGWYAGLAHYGIDPAPWRAAASNRRWTAARLAQALQQRVERGQSLRYTDVRREHPTLAAALSSLHGGWYAGLAHYGIDPGLWQPQPRASATEQ